MDVREIGARIRRVMEATEEALALTEPRENAFLKLHMDTKKLLVGTSFVYMIHVPLVGVVVCLLRPFS